MTGQSVSVPIYRERLHPGVWLVRALGGVRCDPVQLACLLSCCSRVSVRSQAPCSPMPRLATRRATHDWLPDLHWKPPPRLPHSHRLPLSGGAGPPDGDRKSTRLNSSHITISYAVFCLKKKK